MLGEELWHLLDFLDFEARTGCVFLVDSKFENLERLILHLLQLIAGAGSRRTLNREDLAIRRFHCIFLLDKEVIRLKLRSIWLGFLLRDPA
jgi:hypothetical protein